MSDIRLSPHLARTILHLDADSFFATCEQALNPRLKGRPVVTGGERGVVTAASMEAKRIGVSRGMQTWQVKRDFPQVIVCSSNFGSYGLFSQRMFNIIQRYTPVVEEYSIDEAFADITGLRRPLNMSYLQIGQRIQSDIQRELDISVSIGISSSKVLAKVASKWRKPHGLVYIKHSEIPHYLSQLPVEEVWGIGTQTAGYLNKYGIKTALHFIEQTDLWINKSVSKPYQETWHELRGESVLKVNSEAKRTYASISKTKTFYPYTSDARTLYAQLIRNLEGALHKARRFQLAPQAISIFLKTHYRGGYFKKYAREAKLSCPSSLLPNLTSIVRELFDQTFQSQLVYRATGVTLSHFQNDATDQLDLFSDPVRIIQMHKLADSIDEIKNKYGRDSIHTATTSLVTPKSKAPLMSIPIAECH